MVTLPDHSVPTGSPTYTAGAKLGFFLWVDDKNTWHARVSGDQSLGSYAYTVTLAADSMDVSNTNHESGDMAPQTYNNGSQDVLVLSGRVDADQDGADFTVGDSSALTVSISGYSFNEDDSDHRTDFDGSLVFLGSSGTALGESAFMIELTS